VQPLQFRLLGPVGLWLAGDEVELGPARQRSVLAILLLSHDQPLPTGALIARVWGEDPPARACHVLYTYVTRLRSVLGRAAAVRLSRRTCGYTVDIEPEVIDVCRFNRLLASAEQAGDAGARIRVLREALALWRGEPLAGLSGDWIDRTRERLRRQRIGALVTCFDLELRLGRHARVSHELCDLVARHPTVEPLVGQLMLALYRCGRQAEALEVFREARRTLVEQQGLEPGQALRQLERSILSDDRALQLS